MAVKITKDTIIGSVLDIAPQAAPLFLAIGIDRKSVGRERV